MSQSTDQADELRELRERLQGALEDNASLRTKLDRAAEQHGRLDLKIQEVTNHRDRLLEEKRQFNNWIVEKPGGMRDR